jgi:hypothetical protein
VQTPSIRGKASLSFTLEMDEESLVDLERAVSYASEYMPTTTPRLELLLVTVKKMVKTLIHASPILLDIGQDVLHRSDPQPQLLLDGASTGTGVKVTGSGVRVVENCI